MKTNTINLIIAAAATSSIGLLAANNITATYLPMIATSISYLAVAALIAFAAFDNRRGSKCYDAR